MKRRRADGIRRPAHDDPRASLRKVMRDCLADSAAGTGDDRYLSLQPPVVGPIASVDFCSHTNKFPAPALHPCAILLVPSSPFLRLAPGFEIEHLVFIQHTFFTPNRGIECSTS
jgi:hypothetical protein